MASSKRGDSAIITELFQDLFSNDDLLPQTWWSDVAIITAMKYYYNDTILSDIMHTDSLKACSQLNMSISKSNLLMGIDSIMIANIHGYYRIKMRVVVSSSLSNDNKKRYHYFYFKSINSLNVPSAITMDSAQQIFTREIRFSEEKRNLRNDTLPHLHRHINNDMDVSNTPPTPPPTVVHLPVRLESDINVFWESLECRKLFNTHTNETAHDRVHILIDICNTKVKKIIAGSPIFLKYILLKKAYNVALTDMPLTKNLTNCCEEAVIKMHDAGIDNNLPKCPRSISKWNRYFRVHLTLEGMPEATKKNPSRKQKLANNNNEVSIDDNDNDNNHGNK